ncbi:MAG: hypothetical protein L0Y58_18580 [Verrucomicrobia subdivision 3 bacterium]|nr:hypothetical protein [Limisphaerales bacterium]
MNTKPPECWASDPNARGVKIELSLERSLVLPHDQFTFSELTSDGKEQRLRLVFATHEVLVRGTCLRRIESAMQREELSLLTRLPEHQKSLVGEGHPVVLQITVSEAGAAASSVPV